MISVALTQNNSTEAQAQTRQSLQSRLPSSALGAFWPELCHRSYGSQIFGGPTGKPGGRMPAASLFTSPVCACDPQVLVDAKQEGTP